MKCQECGQKLPDYCFKAGQCKCGRYAWWYDDGGHQGIEREHKKDRCPGKQLERMVRPWA